MLIVHDDATGVDHAPVTTNDSGVFVVPCCRRATMTSPPARRILHGEAPRRKPGGRQTVRVDIEMPVSAQQTLVTVTPQSSILETEKTDQTANINENLVSNLPVSSRRMGATRAAHRGRDSRRHPRCRQLPRPRRPVQQQYRDGAANTFYYDQTTRGGYNEAYVYSSDSIREFPSSPRVWRRIGTGRRRSVNAVTRSGTAQFHGDVFYNGRTPGFNA